MKDEALHQLIECARLLGQTQAKKGFGTYTQQDSRFEVAMYKSIHEHEAKIKKALAQSEQEPVAYEPVWDSGPTNKDYEDAMRMKRLNQLVTPPQRKPLTDEHIDSRAEQSDSYASFHAGVRFAEAAHGIKENT